MNYNKYFNKLTWWEILIWVVFLFGLLYGIFCLNAWLLMLVWNSVIPSIFSLTTITFKQSCLLILLVWILRSFPYKFSWNNQCSNTQQQK